MREKIKKIIKPFLAVITAGFIVSILYVGLVNKKTKEVIKLPEISGYDYSDLDSRISDLEWKVEGLESQISDLESGVEDVKSRTDEIEDFINCVEYSTSSGNPIMEDDWYYCSP